MFSSTFMLADVCVLLFVSVVDSQHSFDANIYSDVHYRQYHTDVSVAVFILVHEVNLGFFAVN